MSHLRGTAAVDHSTRRPPPTFMHNFIAETIYGLKIEYGEPVFLTNVKKTDTNYSTGAQTSIQESQLIPLLIIIPISLRQAFLKSVGIHKVGYLETGEQEFLLDTTDQDIEIGEEAFLTTDERRYKIKTIEDYEHCKIIVAKTYGQPLIYDMYLDDSIDLQDGVSNA